MRVRTVRASVPNFVPSQPRKGPFDGIGLGMHIPLGNRDAGMSGNAGQRKGIAT
ncbi:MAG: hypothetical protein WBD54_13450 [Candidatus Acidiferrales bacterium]